ncbi:MAG: hypothetical protein HY348_11930 [Nitrospira defluvii]|nr:hypothetical protein [Nitrospira defluvii]
MAGSYPDRAVAIWKQLAEKQIALTKPKAYEEAAGYLRKVQRVLKQLGKEQDWQGYLTALRRANERKRRLVQILDTLAGRRIIEGCGDAKGLAPPSAAVPVPVRSEGGPTPQGDRPDASRRSGPVPGQGACPHGVR